MYLFDLKENSCCGCSACVDVCPKKAVFMQSNSQGFLYPVIDKEKCVDCHLCEKVCRFTNESTINNVNNTVCYGLKCKDDTVRKNSRSGGAFYVIAEHFLRNENAKVWGAAFDRELHVRHICITSHDNLNMLQGSKYVQSAIDNVFYQIGEQLKAGDSVLFSGTACQIDGLYGFLDTTRIDYSKLLTCDIICQGVPSPRIFQDYINALENKYNGVIESFNFRDKQRLGWSGHEESFVVKGKKHYSSKYKTYYYKYYMRSSCFECPYTSLNRPADITLGDFWGVFDKYPQFGDKKGVSLVIGNTDKGNKIISTLGDSAELISVDKENCLQPRLRKPSDKPADYDSFWRDFERYGGKYCLDTYGKQPIKDKIILQIIIIAKRLLKK